MGRAEHRGAARGNRTGRARRGGSDQPPAQALGLARKEWHAVSQRVGGLLGAVPGSDARSIPTIEHVDTAIRDVLRATADVPPPLPARAAESPGDPFAPHGEIEAGVRLGDPDRFDVKDRFVHRITNAESTA